jgi:hypothetical protein
MVLPFRNGWGGTGKTPLAYKFAEETLADGEADKKPRILVNLPNGAAA